MGGAMTHQSVNQYAYVSFPDFPETSEPGLILQTVKGSLVGTQEVPGRAA